MVKPYESQGSGISQTLFVSGLTRSDWNGNMRLSFQFFYFIGNSFSYKVKMLRRDATRVELKMHLRAHTGAQRVTK